MPQSRWTADELRSDFDRGFARAPDAAKLAELDLLLLRIGDQRYALPLSQVAALHADRKLTEAPSPRRELLGLVGLRGAVTPVYDLGALLGHETHGVPRWLVQVVGSSPLALAFEHFEAHVRVPLASLIQQAAAASTSVVLTDGTARLLDLHALFRSMQSSRRAESSTERGEERP